MLSALDKYFPGNFKWSRPEGGMFIWAEGPAGLDMEKLYHSSMSFGLPAACFMIIKSSKDDLMLF
jgi:2-aminoadipate transaminase